MNNFTKEELKDLIIGLIVIVASVIIAGIYKWQSSVWADAKATDYPVYATFNRTDGLEVGDKVRMAGVDIGYVADSVLDENFRATLTLMIKSNVEIPDDSSAGIVSSGILGNKYIEIEAGGSEDFIAQNGEFEYTQDAMVLEELVDRIISLGKAKRHQNTAKAETPIKEVCEKTAADDTSSQNMEEK